MSAPDTFVDLGESECGRCGMGFDDRDPAHAVARRRVEPGGTFDYPEDAPWHTWCIEAANAEGLAGE